MLDPQRWSLFFLALITLLAAYLRAQFGLLDYESDEFALLGTEGFYGTFINGESGVNPPLLRLLFDATLPPMWTLKVGRAFSLICSVATIPVVYAITVKASRGGRYAGLCAALFCAAHLQLVIMGARYRSYAALGFTLALHLWFAVDRLEDEDTFPSKGLLVTAILLPWWHYSMVPLLGIFALYALSRKDWAAVKAYAASFLAIAPMAYFILSDTSRRKTSHAAPEVLLGRMLSLELPDANPFTLKLDQTLLSYLPSLTDIPITLAMLLLVFLVGCGLFFRRLGQGERLLWLGTSGFLIVLLILDTAQLVRSPLVIPIVLMIVPLIMSITQHPTSPTLQSILPLAFLLVVGRGMPHQLQGSLHSRSNVGAAELAEHWTELIGDEPQTIYVWPARQVGLLHLYLTESLHMIDEENYHLCPPSDRCFEVEGQLFQSTPSVQLSQAPPPGLYGILDYEKVRLPGCTALIEEKFYQLWRCP